jgi:hypothetical protein
MSCNNLTVNLWPHGQTHYLPNTINHHNPVSSKLLQYTIDDKNVNQGSENGYVGTFSPILAVFPHILDKNNNNQ